MEIEKRINPLKTYRDRIVHQLRELRHENRLTQSELAKLLDLSQARVSEIERGKGSLSAEQLLVLLGHFNVPLDRFLDRTEDRRDQWQNTLARLGAHHLAEKRDVIVPETLSDAYSVLREILSAGGPTRHLTGLAPVIIKFAHPSILSRSRADLAQLGLSHRWGWLVENTVEGINQRLNSSPSEEAAKEYRRANFILKQALIFPRLTPDAFDPLDYPVRSEKALDDLIARSSEISRKWHIASPIQPEDFADALRSADETTN